MINSLRVRLTLLFIILTIVPLVVVGTAISQRGYNTLEDQAIILQGQLAEQAEIKLQAFFSERQNELRVLTETYGLDLFDPRTQRDILATLLTDQPAYYELALIDADGQESIRVTRGEVITTENLSNLSDDPLFQEVVASGTVSISPVYFNEAARDRLVTLALPIEDLFTGNVGQVLIAEIRFQTVEEVIVRGLDFVEGADVYIVDPQGVVVAHRNPNFVINETVFDLPTIDGQHTGIMGDNVILARQSLQVENLSLIVVSEVPYEVATALAFDLTNLALGVTLITLLLASAIGIWMITQIVNPITAMARVAHAIEEGDLSARADEAGSSEIGALGRSFNAMTRQLEQTLTGLQESVVRLEKSQEEREALIKDLQAAKRLAEENSRLKSEFLSTMSHELRTPMNAIEGFTSIMLKRMGGVDYNDKAERFLNKVQSNSQRLLHLINDFLDLSRIESGRLELAHLPIVPREMAQKWQDELGILAQRKELEFDVFIDPALPDIIHGDEETLSKIATNLLGNAFKFTTEGKVALSLERRGNTMAIIVTDTGIGIPPHAREFIFDEFRMVDQSSKRAYGGTGLGLAIVDKLTRQMGGKVSVESEIGKGSTFTVIVPIQMEMAHAS